MKCKTARNALLDLLDEQMDREQRGAVEEHLAECPECAVEYQTLQKGHEALRQSITRIAPQKRHLTRERLEALERHIERDRTIFTLPRFVGAAAAAAILVAVLFLYQDVRGWMEPQAPAGRPKISSVPQQHEGGGEPVRLQLSSFPNGRKLDTVRGYVAAGEAFPPADSSSDSSRPRILRTATPGVRVPVHNTLYDPEEDGYWW